MLVWLYFCILEMIVDIIFLDGWQWFKMQKKKKGERLLVPASPAKPKSAQKQGKSSEAYLEGCEFVTFGRLSITQVSSTCVFIVGLSSFKHNTNQASIG